MSMKKSSHPKQQHYVPQFFLRRFARRRKKTHKLHVLDVETGRRFQSPVNRAACQRAFYDQPIDDSLVATLEPSMADFEDTVAPAIAKLVASRNVHDLTMDERTHIGVFVMTQHVRGPSTRNTMSAMNKVLHQFVADRVGDEVALGVLKNHGMTDDRVKIDHAAVMMSVVQECTPAYVQRPWFLLQPPLGREFNTSDNPVLKINYSEAPPGRGNQGLFSSGLVLYMALSPSLLLAILDDDLPELGRPTKIESEHLLHYDWLLAAQAERYLYSRMGRFHFPPEWQRTEPKRRFATPMRSITPG